MTSAKSTRESQTNEAEDVISCSIANLQIKYDRMLLLDFGVSSPDGTPHCS